MAKQIEGRRVGALAWHSAICVTSVNITVGATLLRALFQTVADKAGRMHASMSAVLAA
jgi:hypothetical protein